MPKALDALKKHKEKSEEKEDKKDEKEVKEMEDMPKTRKEKTKVKVLHEVILQDEKEEVDEHMNALVAGQDDLSEEFKTKAQLYLNQQ